MKHTTLILGLLACVTFLSGCSSVTTQTVRAPRGDYREIEAACCLDDYSEAILQPLQIDECVEVPEIIQRELSFQLLQSLLGSGKFRSVGRIKAPGKFRGCPGKTLIIQPSICGICLDSCNAEVDVTFVITDSTSGCNLGTIFVMGSGGDAGIHAAVTGVGMGIEQFFYNRTSID